VCRKSNGEVNISHEIHTNIVVFSWLIFTSPLAPKNIGNLGHEGNNITLVTFHFVAQLSRACHGLLLYLVSSITHNDASRPVGLLWMSDQPVTEISDNTHNRQTSTAPEGFEQQNLSVDNKNQLDVTFCILYFSSNSCSTCEMKRTHPWTHYLPTGLDSLPAATAHTNTRL
jgi:hypothetical protein